MFSNLRKIVSRHNFNQNQEVWSLHRFIVFFFSIHGFKKMKLFSGNLFRFGIRKVFGGPLTEDVVYAKWRRKNMPKKKYFNAIRKHSHSLQEQPKFSVVLEIQHQELSLLKKTIDSVTNQIYSNWELIISLPNHIDYKKDPLLVGIETHEKVTILQEQQECTLADRLNNALENSTGGYFCIIEQNDCIEIDALFQFASAISNNPRLDLIYSDEDKFNKHDKFFQPYFKPQWSPDTFLTRNYIGHLCIVKSSLFNSIGKFKPGYEGAESYEMMLRATEQTSEIYRIPKVLYHSHWIDKPSFSSELLLETTKMNTLKALNDSLNRRGTAGKASLLKTNSNYSRIKYDLIEAPKISIIIPTKNNSSVLTTCIESIFNLTNYPDFEVIIINNNSDEAALFEKFEEWKEKFSAQIVLLDCLYQFNYSRLMNDGVSASSGEYILLLNNDTEVLDGEWINDMLRHAQRQQTGAVGAKLLFPNDTVQHAGVVLGIGRVAGHTFVAAEKEEEGTYGYLSTVVNYSAVTAACLLVSKRKYLEVDGFDETLSIEYNDVDFCLKLIEKGYYNMLNPDVVLYHYESLTRGHPYSNRATYKRHQTETEYFKSKWQKIIDNDPFYNPNLSLVTTHLEPDVTI
jgi:GT2 family glycosyltransferase